MPRSEPDDATSVRDMLIASGFDAAAADRLLTGPPTERRSLPPRYDNLGKVEGLVPGGGSTGRHTSTRGTVDGDRTA